MKVHLGCGHNFLHGWSNHDLEVDIRKKLPWRDGEVHFVFAEHLIEHVTFPDGIRFLDECRRILRPGGVLRLSFPDAERIMDLSEGSLERYLELMSETASKHAERSFLPLQSREDGLRLMFCGWGHQSAWTASLAHIALRVARFKNVALRAYGTSEFAELSDVDRHHEQSPAAKICSTIVEAW